MTQAAPAPATTEVLFYHLESQPLEKVLPSLLEKTVQRGWRAVVQSGSAERLEALDLTLWTYADDSFLAHGTAKDDFAEDQPIFLTTGHDAPNGARVRFFVDGADADAERVAGLVRAIFIFDGNDEAATGDARRQWQAMRAAGLACTYWRQSAEGRWEKKA